QSGVPTPTKIVTAEPRGAALPPAGAWATTRPVSRRLLLGVGTLVTEKPADRSTAVAAPARLPITLGTWTRRGKTGVVRTGVGLRAAVRVGAGLVGGGVLVGV